LKTRYPILIITILSGILSSGCQTITRPGEKASIPETVDELVIQDEYGKALQKLGSIAPTHPDYDVLQTKKKLVLKKAQSYERRNIIRAVNLSERSKWSDALNVINDALSRYPDSKPMHETRLKILSERREYMQTLNYRATISRAVCLLNEKPWREKRALIDPDDRTAQWELASLQKEINNSTTNLVECGRQSIINSNLELASDCLSQARVMRPHDEDLKYIISLQKKISGKVKKASLKKQKSVAVQTVANIIKARILRSIDKKDFNTAKIALARLIEVVPDDREISAYRKRYQLALARQVNLIIDRGTVLYRHEKIAQARSVWETAQKIDPDNKEVQKLIQRADKVLGKLKQLRSNQGTGN